MKTFNYLRNSLIIVTVIALILCILVSCFTWKANKSQQAYENIQSELNTLQETLLIKNNELETVKETLKIEIKKTNQLNEALEQSTEELAIANMIIEDLKSEEYEFVYLGEFTITHYCDERIPNHICGGSGVTASGKSTEVGWTAAADTSILPMGSVIYIPGYGVREVQDTGSAVAGHHIDVLVEHHDEALKLGVKAKDVWLLVRKSS